MAPHRARAYDRPRRTAALPAGQLVVGDQYDIAETTAPSGYEVRSGTLCVTVQADGALATVGEAPDGWSLDGAQASVTVTDQLVEAFVKKVDAADNKPLPGATFQVTGSFADSAEPVKTLSTNTDGLAAVTGLIVGETYAVAETARPPVIRSSPERARSRWTPTARSRWGRTRTATRWLATA